jgi:hypothetical protein
MAVTIISRDVVQGAYAPLPSGGSVAAGDRMFAVLRTRNTGSAHSIAGTYDYTTAASNDYTMSALFASTDEFGDLGDGTFYSIRAYLGPELTSGQATAVNAGYSSGADPSGGDQGNDSYGLWLRPAGATAGTGVYQGGSGTYTSATNDQDVAAPNASFTAATDEVVIGLATVWGGDSGGGNWTSASAAIADDAGNLTLVAREVDTTAKKMTRGGDKVGGTCDIAFHATVGGANDYITAIYQANVSLPFSSTTNISPDVSNQYERLQAKARALPFYLDSGLLRRL